MIGGGIYLVNNVNYEFNKGDDSDRLVSDFESCVGAGNPVMRSYPRKCSDGINTFTEILTEEEINFTRKKYYKI